MLSLTKLSVALVVFSVVVLNWKLDESMSSPKKMKFSTELSVEKGRTRELSILDLNTYALERVFRLCHPADRLSLRFVCRYFFEMFAFSWGSTKRIKAGVMKARGLKLSFYLSTPASIPVPSA